LGTGIAFGHPAVAVGAGTTLAALRIFKHFSSQPRAFKKIFGEAEKITGKFDKRKPLNEMLESKYYKKQADKNIALEKLIQQRADEAVQEGFSRGI